MVSRRDVQVIVDADVSRLRRKIDQERERLSRLTSTDVGDERAINRVNAALERLNRQLAQRQRVLAGVSLGANLDELSDAQNAQKALVQELEREVAARRRALAAANTDRQRTSRTAAEAAAVQSLNNALRVRNELLEEGRRVGLYRLEADVTPQQRLARQQNEEARQLLRQGAEQAERQIASRQVSGAEEAAAANARDNERAQEAIAAAKREQLRAARELRRVESQGTNRSQIGRARAEVQEAQDQLRRAQRSAARTANAVLEDSDAVPRNAARRLERAANQFLQARDAVAQAEQRALRPAQRPPREQFREGIGALRAMLEDAQDFEDPRELGVHVQQIERAIERAQEAQARLTGETRDTAQAQQRVADQTQEAVQDTARLATAEQALVRLAQERVELQRRLNALTLARTAENVRTLGVRGTPLRDTPESDSLNEDLARNQRQVQQFGRALAEGLNLDQVRRELAEIRPVVSQINEEIGEQQRRYHELYEAALRTNIQERTRERRLRAVAQADEERLAIAERGFITQVRHAALEQRRVDLLAAQSAEQGRVAEQAGRAAVAQTRVAEETRETAQAQAALANQAEVARARIADMRQQVEGMAASLRDAATERFVRGFDRLASATDRLESGRVEVRRLQESFAAFEDDAEGATNEVRQFSRALSVTFSGRGLGSLSGLAGEMREVEEAGQRARQVFRGQIGRTFFDQIRDAARALNIEGAEGAIARAEVSVGAGATEAAQRARRRIEGLQDEVRETVVVADRAAAALDRFGGSVRRRGAGGEQQSRLLLQAAQTGVQRRGFAEPVSDPQLLRGVLQAEQQINRVVSEREGAYQRIVEGVRGEALVLRQVARPVDSIQVAAEEARQSIARMNRESLLLPTNANRAASAFRVLQAVTQQSGDAIERLRRQGLVGDLAAAALRRPPVTGVVTPAGQAPVQPQPSLRGDLAAFEAQVRGTERATDAAREYLEETREAVVAQTRLARATRQTATAGRDVSEGLDAGSVARLRQEAEALARAVARLRRDQTGLQQVQDAIGATGAQDRQSQEYERLLQQQVESSQARLREVAGTDDLARAEERLSSIRARLAGQPVPASPVVAPPVAAQAARIPAVAAAAVEVPSPAPLERARQAIAGVGEESARTETQLQRLLRAMRSGDGEQAEEAFQQLNVRLQQLTAGFRQARAAASGAFLVGDTGAGQQLERQAEGHRQAVLEIGRQVVAERELTGAHQALLAQVGRVGPLSDANREMERLVAAFRLASSASQGAFRLGDSGTGRELERQAAGHRRAAEALAIQAKESGELTQEQQRLLASLRSISETTREERALMRLVQQMRELEQAARGARAVGATGVAAGLTSQAAALRDQVRAAGRAAAASDNLSSAQRRLLGSINGVIGRGGGRGGGGGGGAGGIRQLGNSINRLHLRMLRLFSVFYAVRTVFFTVSRSFRFVTRSFERAFRLLERGAQFGAEFLLATRALANGSARDLLVVRQATAELGQELEDAPKLLAELVEDAGRALTGTSRTALQTSHLYRQLGIDRERLRELASEPLDLFAAVFEGLQDVESQAERFQIASQLLGDSSRDLVANADLLGPSLERATQRIARQGTITRAQANAARLLNAELAGMRSFMSQVSGVIAARLGPSVTDLLNRIFAVTGGVQGLGRTLSDLIALASRGFGRLLQLVSTAAIVFTNLSGAFGGLRFVLGEDNFNEFRETLLEVSVLAGEFGAALQNIRTTDFFPDVEPLRNLELILHSNTIAFREGIQAANEYGDSLLQQTRNAIRATGRRIAAREEDLAAAEAVGRVTDEIERQIAAREREIREIEQTIAERRLENQEVSRYEDQLLEAFGAVLNLRQALGQDITPFLDDIPGISEEMARSLLESRTELEGLREEADRLGRISFQSDQFDQGLRSIEQGVLRILNDTDEVGRALALDEFQQGGIALLPSRLQAAFLSYRNGVVAVQQELAIHQAQYEQLLRTISRLSDLGVTEIDGQPLELYRSVAEQTFSSASAAAEEHIERLRELRDSQLSFGNALHQALSEQFDNLGASIAEALTTAEEGLRSLGDLFENFVQRLIGLLIQSQIEQALAGLVGAFPGFFGTGGAAAAAPIVGPPAPSPSAVSSGASAASSPVTVNFSPTIQTSDQASVQRGIEAALPAFMDAAQRSIGSNLGRRSTIRRAVFGVTNSPGRARR